MKVIGEAGDGREAIEVIERLQPRIVVLDLSMPELDGLEAIPLIHQVSPATEIVVFSGFEEAQGGRGRAAPEGQPLRPQGRPARGAPHRRKGSRRLNRGVSASGALPQSRRGRKTGDPAGAVLPARRMRRSRSSGARGGRARWACSAPSALAIVKFGAKLKALLLLLPKLKLFTTSASMLVSIGAYTLIWGWKFAVGFVLLLLVHEMGHVLQAQREGLDASAPLFIPFLGAAIALKELPKDAGVEARVGLAGPILGTLGTCVAVAIWQITGEELFQALAFFGFFLNLFNLAPVLPLDGGRAMAALTPWMWIVGYALLDRRHRSSFPNPIMFLILLFGGMETYRRWKERKDPEQQRFFEVPARTRAAVAITYVGLALALVVGMDATFLERDFNDV